VTQRPAEIDTTILSQCSTLFVMRLSSERDQALVRAAVSDAGSTMLTFIPTLGTAEVFAFGAGVPLPTRMKFRDLPAALRPISEVGGSTRLATEASPGRDMINSVIDRWRASTMSHKGQTEDASAELCRDDVPAAREELPRYQSAPPLAPEVTAPVAPAFEPPPHTQPPPLARPSILRRPVSPGPPGPNNPAPLPGRYR
jgi:hypothetical protein